LVYGERALVDYDFLKLLLIVSVGADWRLARWKFDTGYAIKEEPKAGKCHVISIRVKHDFVLCCC
jgi:molybdopterin-containing oxidoreductase family iron-sulfur binding subunit